MKIIRIGTKVSYTLFGEKTLRTAMIEGIEICKEGQKYGRPVNSVDISKHHHVVCDLSDSHWCYAFQIKNIINY